MAVSASTHHPGPSRTPRVRGIGAAAAVLALFGTAVLAPLSVSSAFARDGLGAMAAEVPDQEFTSAASVEQDFELTVSTVEAVPGTERGSGFTGKAVAGALYTLQQFMFSGVVEWQGYKFTYYSQQVLPGPGLQIPGRHVNEDGYVSDEDGYIVLAGSAPKGTVFETPFGHPGKIYDRGTVGNHLDVYIR
ncbi:hypothetical protein J4H92_08120 [Leucobacter weissii]|uniref:Uncharacterized protein n=1 Tax=Leucobacter weissii TaxID=1983706 RepID=A0A939MJJ0_9MICO|nr:hypothetical protein [Leucobacter weissii]MBO1901913.1 hypothetical protein [Leucobacter weissii]